MIISFVAGKNKSGRPAAGRGQGERGAALRGGGPPALPEGISFSKKGGARGEKGRQRAKEAEVFGASLLSGTKISSIMGCMNTGKRRRQARPSFHRSVGTR